MDIDELIKKTLEYGAHKAERIEPSRLTANRDFRKYCEDNVCGSYGRCWACPPDIGDIDGLIEELKKYDHVMMYQIITPVKDYSDKKEMDAAMDRLADIAQQLQVFLRNNLRKPFLNLGGACHLCLECAKISDQPCRYPDKMIPSMSAYGIDVCRTCDGTSLEYMNGDNTVTSFGMVLYNE